MIRSATPADAPAIAGIYNHYILHTPVTFEEEPVSAEQVRGRIAETQTAYPWLVHERNEIVTGYAYATGWHSRRSYQHSVETTVYLDRASIGNGIGFQLYGELIRTLKTSGFHTAIGGIALPNDRSVALHEKLGFTKIAHFREVGRKFDRWIDVGYWQLIL